MDAHKYNEGPSPAAQDHVEAEAKRLGISNDRAWAIYHNHYKRGHDSDPFAGCEPDDFLDGDEVELVEPFTSSTVYGVLK